MRPPTRWIVVASAQSAAGDALLELAMLWSVAQESSSAAAVGLLAIVIAVASTLGGVFGAPLADRFTRTTLLTGLDVIRAIAISLLAVAAVAHTWPLYYVVAAFEAAVGVLHVAASRSVLADLEPAGRLPAVNGLVQSATALGSIIGYGIAGGLFPLVGLAPLALADAVTFVVSAGLLFRAIRPLSLPVPARSREGEGYARELRLGVDAVLNRPIVFGMIVVTVAAVSLLAPIDALGPALVKEQLGGLVGMLAAMEIATMTGRIAGGLGARRLALDHPDRLLAAVLVTLAIATAAIGWLASGGVVLAAYLTLGFGASISAVAILTVLQRELPTATRSRVLALHGALLQAVPLVGIWLFTWLADVAGAVQPYRTMAGCLLGLAVATVSLPWLAARRPSRREAKLELRAAENVEMED